MKQKIYNSWICMFIRSRYRLSVYKRTFWQYCEENLHPCFLIDYEFLVTSTDKQKVRYLTGLYTRREIAHRKSIGEDFEWLLKTKISYPTVKDLALLPSHVD